MILENPTMCPDSSELLFYFMYNKDILLPGVKSVDGGLLTNIVIYKATTNFLSFSMDFIKKKNIELAFALFMLDVILELNVSM